MNSALRKILGEANLLHLEEKFLESGVCNIHILSLVEDEKDIGELAPKLGDRLQLKNLIKRIRKEASVACFLEKTVSTADTIDCHLLDVNEEQILLSPSTSKNTSSQHSSSDEVHLDKNDNLEESITIETRDDFNDYEESEELVSSEINTVTLELSNNHNDSKVFEDDKATTSKYQLNNCTPKKLVVITDITDERILNIIKNSGPGMKVLEYYESANKLTPDFQSQLTRVIIENLIQNEDYRLPSSSLSTIADCIVKIFPEESKGVYYSESVSGCGKRKLYRGKLNDRYKNYRGFLKNCTKKAGLDNINTEPKSQNMSSAESTIVNNALAWLKHNISPFRQVQEYWKLTVENRIMTEGSLASVVDQWPALKHDKGFHLVRQTKIISCDDCS